MTFDKNKKKIFIHILKNTMDLLKTTFEYF